VTQLPGLNFPIPPLPELYDLSNRQEWVLPSPQSNIFLYQRCVGQVFDVNLGQRCPGGIEATIYNTANSQYLGSIYNASNSISGIDITTETRIHSPSAAWSSDGHYLAYQSVPEGLYQDFDLAIFDVSSGTSLELNALNELIDYNLAIDWSPTGNKLIFWVIGRYGEDREGDGDATWRSPVILDVDQEKFVSSDITFQLPAGFLGNPVTWSPNGEALVFLDVGQNLIHLDTSTGMTTTLDTSVSQIIDWKAANSSATPTFTPTPTATFTPTPTNTPTRTPPPLPWTCETVMTLPGTSGTLPGTGNLIINPGFTTNLNNWQTSAASSTWVSGQMSVIPTTTGTEGAFFQSTVHDAIADTVYELRLNARNASTSNYTFHLLVREGSWIERYSCYFTLPPAPILQTFILRFRPQYTFRNMVVQGWLIGPNSGGVRVDDVSLTRLTGVALTPFVEGNVALPTSTGTPITNLIQNGAFSAALSPSWAAFNAFMQRTTPGGNGAMEIARNAGSSSGGFYQIAPYAVPADAVVELKFKVGNLTGVSRGVTLMLRDPYWYETRTCTITLPANAPLTEYTLHMRTTRPWATITVQGFLLEGEYTGTPPNNTTALRFDDFSLIYPGSQPTLTDLTVCSSGTAGAQSLMAGADVGLQAGLDGVNATLAAGGQPTIGPSPTPLGYIAPSLTPTLGAPTLTPSRTPSPTRMPSATRTSRP
jgi:hypothetical protein